MTVVLALDTATTVGFAFGEIGATPTWGAWNFTSKGGTGEVLHKFRRQLVATCDEVKPILIVYESPYVPRQFYNGPPINPTTLRRLFALVGVVDEVAWGLGVECLEATVPEIAKFFLGNAKQGGRAAKKAATIKMCQLYGWDTVSDDAADALALWCLAEHTIAPQIGSRRSASARRELPIHGTLDEIVTAAQEPRLSHEEGREQHWPAADVEASPVKRSSEKVEAGVRTAQPRPSSEGGRITRHGGEPRTVHTHK